jgi:hypothetical protein
VIGGEKTVKLEWDVKIRDEEFGDAHELFYLAASVIRMPIASCSFNASIR